jgi:carbamoyl-phosphate synthase large subunit
MQSTGEVIGIHTDPRVALAKAMQGAALIPPRPGADGALALLSVAERDHHAIPRVARALARAGYQFAATVGTAAELKKLGYEAQVVAKVGEKALPGQTTILDLIAAGNVRLVVNTPSPTSGPVRDAIEIRLAATAEGILCLTAIETAVAAAEALDPDLRSRLAEVRSLGEWVPDPGRPRGAISFG